MDISGWGRSSTAHVRAARPERPRDIDQAFKDATAGGVLARGGGRAYGDAALNDGGNVILTTRLNRLLSFDPITGEVACEPGVTFADLLDVFLPRGFMAPASPGTAFATVGGAVAADVGGENVHGLSQAFAQRGRTPRSGRGQRWPTARPKPWRVPPVSLVRLTRPVRQATPAPWPT